MSSRLIIGIVYAQFSNYLLFKLCPGIRRNIRYQNLNHAEMFSFAICTLFFGFIITHSLVGLDLYQSYSLVILEGKFFTFFV